MRMMGWGSCRGAYWASFKGLNRKRNYYSKNLGQKKILLTYYSFFNSSVWEFERYVNLFDHIGIFEIHALNFYSRLFQRILSVQMLFLVLAVLYFENFRKFLYFFQLLHYYYYSDFLYFRFPLLVYWQASCFQNYHVNQLQEFQLFKAFNNVNYLIHILTEIYNSEKPPFHKILRIRDLSKSSDALFW